MAGRSFASHASPHTQYRPITDLQLRRRHMPPTISPSSCRPSYDAALIGFRGCRQILPAPAPTAADYRRSPRNAAAGLGFGRHPYHCRCSVINRHSGDSVDGLLTECRHGVGRSMRRHAAIHRKYVDVIVPPIAAPEPGDIADAAAYRRQADRRRWYPASGATNAPPFDAGSHHPDNPLIIVLEPRRTAMKPH